MDPHEVKIVRQYAINEVAGGLLLGHHLLRSEDPYVRSQLTYHTLDELKHGWLWTQFLDKKGVGVAGAKGGNEYFDFIGRQEDDMRFLAAVHIYELRVPFHLTIHMELPEIDPELKEVMRGIRDDEKFHLGWIRKYLLEKIKTDPISVKGAVAEAEQIEQAVYMGYLAHMERYGGYAGALVALARGHLSEFASPSSAF
ncbi:MAG: hypothetical protein AAB923_02600 [Patescibacteria group bacterium]